VQDSCVWRWRSRRQHLTKCRELLTNRWPALQEQSCNVKDIKCNTMCFKRIGRGRFKSRSGYFKPKGWSKSLCAPDGYSTKISKQLIIWRWPSQNTFGMWTVLYWTQFGVSLNVWRLVGDILNITCNLLYSNHQVHRDILSPCRVYYRKPIEVITLKIWDFTLYTEL